MKVTIAEAATDGENNYATLYYDKNLEVPQGVGVTAHTAKVDETGKIILTQIEGVIPANTGVVLKTESKLTENTEFEFTVTETTGTADVDNMLKGTVDAQTITGEGYKYYMLSLNANKDANSVGFYFDKNSNGGTKLNNGANKAYLAVPAGVAAKGYPFGGDETGINGLNVDVNDNANEVFDLQGRRVNVNNMPKGIYIVNGKKIVVK